MLLYILFKHFSISLPVSVVFFRSVHCGAEYVGQLLTESKRRKRSQASRFSLSVKASLVKYIEYHSTRINSRPALFRKDRHTQL